jgi:hypothetical protein
MRRSVIVVVTAAVAVLIAVSPVMAAGSDLGAKVKCRYTATQEGNNGWTEANLSRIDVKPPQMYSLSGTQRVGWRFAIERQVGGGDGVETYRSPWQRATATRTQPAPFTTRGVNVKLPVGADLTTVRYLVLLGRIYYNADGTVEVRGLGGIREYRYFVDGTLESNAWGYAGCGGQMKR